MDSREKTLAGNFIIQRIEKDLKEGKNDGRVHTRFPPEPNGYLHIGHAKSICLNFGIAREYNGKCNLRFDDTNPETEEVSYVNSIKKDIKWLGFDWDNEFYASDYFDTFYEYAVRLIEKGKAYVDDQSQEIMSKNRGVPTKPGIESPFRNRAIEENLNLFEEMKNGLHPEGSRALRARIDMSSPNMHLRDPVLYRIKKTPHHRTGDKWCIYPTYDFAHGQSDSIEKITHSLCTLEFEVHRPLYDWLVREIEIFTPQQIEFARLNLTYTIMSKRKLLQLVNEKHVKGWDDPRMPTISGMRRRGYTPASIRNFSDRIGVAKRDGVIDLSLLEFSVREELNKESNRVMAVLYPIRLIITNYPVGKTEMLPAKNNPENPDSGTRELPFSKTLLIEREDFMENPPSKFFRLGPDRMVRLKYAYIIKCTGYEKDTEGKITEVRCEYFPNSRSGSDTSGLKTKGVIHWVSEQDAINAEVRLYDRLFVVEEPGSVKDKSLKDMLNPASEIILKNAKVEPSLKEAKELDKFQFERTGYFCVDGDSLPGNLVFNRTVTLKDSWIKEKAKI
jgi:glutaminyl-tRNA synthetase